MTKNFAMPEAMEKELIFNMCKSICRYCSDLRSQLNQVEVLQKFIEKAKTEGCIVGTSISDIQDYGPIQVTGEVLGPILAEKLAVVQRQVLIDSQQVKAMYAIISQQLKEGSST